MNNGDFIKTSASSHQKKQHLIAMRIAGLMMTLALVALSVFVGLSYFRPSYSETEIDTTKSSEIAKPDKDYTVSIVGDISLADNWEVMPQYDNRGKGANGILSDEVLKIMRESDFMVANSEFTVSNRGSKTPGKYYTFRAKPERLSIYGDMGVDLVTLANNHVYDFGPLAFNDMLESFDAIKMPYIGAGRNLAEAKKPYYLILPDGYRVAFVNATRAEKWGIDTPGATATTGGVLLCYDTTEFINTIKEAKANSDYVIAIIHWGTEGSHQLEQVQKTTAQDYLNAGADIIVGGHAHALQGIDYNGGKPIIYNLGDFIFNNGTEDTGILQVKFLARGGVKFYFLPGQQANVFTSLLSGTARTQKINEILSWDGSNAKILDDGEIVAK
ncbi:CapA family protein [Candidatus Saccharibacteria bacterium]|nr:CapA family protein [Candidatus Saccharibacteria bacterium]